MKTYILFALLLLTTATAQINVQRMLSESTIIDVNETVLVQHVLRNHQDMPIQDIIFYEELPDAAELYNCENCQVTETQGSTYVLDVSDILPRDTIVVSYEIRLPSGNHSMVLGHKTYSFMNRTQERLGKKHSVFIPGSRPITMYLIGAVLVLGAIGVIRFIK